MVLHRQVTAWKLPSSLGLDIAVEVHWRPYFLNDWIPREGISREEYLTTKFGSIERYTGITQRVEQPRRPKGLTYASDKMKRQPNTLDCHRLIRWADAIGRAPEMKQKLMDLYFTQGADLTDRDTLVKAAADVGLDADTVRTDLAGDKDVAAVEQEALSAGRRPASRACRATSSATNSRSQARRRWNISPMPSNGWRTPRPTPPNKFGTAMQITAAVVRERSGEFHIERIDLCDPRADELLVEVTATGMCATDLHGRDAYYPTQFPKVFGQRGRRHCPRHRQGGHQIQARRSRRDVLSVVRGMPELPHAAPELLRRSLSLEDERHPRRWLDAAFQGRQADLQRLLPAILLRQFYHRQRALCARKLRKDVPLEHACALACGGQTGAGAVLNVMKPKSGDSFAVFGVGAVGLSGLMAAKIAGCDPIIAVDVHEASSGAGARIRRDAYDQNHASHTDVVGRDPRKLTGLGVRFSLETSALPAVFREAVDALMPAGTCVLLGSARAGTEVTFETPFLQNGRTVRGVNQGDSVPQEFIPRLADYIVAGQFPIERMITFYDLANINRAAAESSAGRTKKPVIRMPHYPRLSSSAKADDQ